MPSFGSPSPEQIKILLTRAEREGMDSSVIKRLTVILHFAENHHSISDTCRQFQISRSTFHRWMERFNPEDLTTLADKSNESQQYRSSAIDQETIELIRRYRMRYLQMGKERIAELLLSEHLSPSSVGRVIERECLYFADTPLHWKKRMEHGVRTENATAEFSEETMRDQPEDADVVPVHEHIVITEEELEVAPKKLRTTWSGMKRFIIVSSVITNVVFVSILLGMALFEHVDTPPSSDLETLQTLHAAPPEFVQK